MTVVRRIMPYHESRDPEATRAFYTRVLGLEEGNFGGGSIGFGSGQAQVLFGPAGVQPDLPDMGMGVSRRLQRLVRDPIQRNETEMHRAAGRRRRHCGPGAAGRMIDAHASPDSRR